MADNEARARVLSSFYPPRHHVLIRHLLADSPPPHPVMTSFMNSPLEKQVVYWEISGWNNS